MTQITELAFEELYKLHHKMVFSLAIKIVKDVQAAEDVAQEVFFRFYKQPREGLAGHESQWLCVVTRNTSLKLIAKSKRLYLSGDNTESMFLEALKTKNAQKSDDEFFTPKHKDALICEDNPLSLLLSSERTVARKKAILKAIAKLPIRLRKLIKLRFFNQLSYAEICEKTNLSSGNVGFLLNKATTILRNKLKYDYGKLK